MSALAGQLAKTRREKAWEEYGLCTNNRPLTGARESVSGLKTRRNQNYSRLKGLHISPFGRTDR